MRNLLNTLICILLTSPLAAFDIALDGVEFGSLQMELADSITPGNQYFSEALNLNEGDVMQVIRTSGGTTDFSATSPFSGFGGYNVTNYVGVIVNQNGLITTATNGAYVVGPATINVGYSFKSMLNGESLITISKSTSNSGYFYAMDYAILRAGASTQSSYVTIPANPSGNFEVKLQTSSDLQTWSPTTPGIFPYGDNAKFFRLVVE